MIRQETDPDVLEIISFKTLTGRDASSVRMKDIAKLIQRLNCQNSDGCVKDPNGEAMFSFLPCDHRREAPQRFVGYQTSASSELSFFRTHCGQHPGDRIPRNRSSQTCGSRYGRCTFALRYTFHSIQAFKAISMLAASVDRLMKWKSRKAWGVACAPVCSLRSRITTRANAKIKGTSIYEFNH